jgi:hypothetical protein
VGSVVVLGHRPPHDPAATAAKMADRPVQEILKEALALRQRAYDIR